MARSSPSVCEMAFNDKVKVLGAGRHGRVIQSPTHKTHAIKIVTSSSFDQREYDIGVLLGELSIGPKVHGLTRCTHRGRSYHLITMAKLTMTLDQWLRKDHSQRELVAAYRDVMKLIDKLHRLGYTHSDLKTANVGLIGKKWVLIDFGWTYKGTRERRSALPSLLTRLKHKFQGIPLPDNTGYQSYFERQFAGL
jgi:RIO-like serine/threonine protein kinase